MKAANVQIVAMSFTQVKKMTNHEKELELLLARMQEIKKQKNESETPSDSTFGYWLSAVSPTVNKNGFSSDEKSGKWCITVSNRKVDDAWAKIKQAVLDDKLSLAKASTKLALQKFKTHIICVYTLDWSDKEELEKTREILRQLGFTKPLKYKRDLETINKVYGTKNEYYLTM